MAVPDFDGLIVLRRGSGKGPCAGYPSEDREHERHSMRPVWQVGGGDTRWKMVPDGFVCSMCKNAFEATPACERVAYSRNSAGSSRCYNRASKREVGVVGPWSPIARLGETEAEHNYCGSHSPSGYRKRKDAIAARHAAERAEYEARTAKRDAVRRATDRLLAETLRWRDDEAETEGFCDIDDGACEHHECRLNRAVIAYETVIAGDGTRGD